MKESSSLFEIIYTTVTQGSEHLSVSHLCEIAGVSRSGYYAWVSAASARNIQEKQDRKDFELVLAAYKPHGYSKGARGIYNKGNRLFTGACTKYNPTGEKRMNPPGV